MGRSPGRPALLLAAMVLSAMPAAAQAEVARCAGEPATITGSPGGDRIHATARPDVIAAGAGADTIVGPGRGDLICGGAGADTLRGGVAEDRLFGGPGADDLRGGRADDRLYGGGGNDVLLGGKADDMLRGGPGGDKLDAGHGDDRARGGKDPDRVIGGWGFDRLWGEEGDGDIVAGAGGRDRMDGGPGARDIVSFARDSAGAKGIYVNLGIDRAAIFGSHERAEPITGFEDVIGSTASDRIAGDLGPNRIDGGGGTDVLSGQPFGCACPLELPVLTDRQDAAFGGSDLDRCAHFEATTSCEDLNPGTTMRGTLDLSLFSRRDAATFVELNFGLDGSTLNIIGVRDDPGPAQEVGVWYAGGAYIIEDPGGVGVRSGCFHLSPVRARCRDHRLSEGITAALGDRDDTLRVWGKIPLLAAGGDGNDSIFGGGANDVIHASRGSDLLDGGGGDDVLMADTEPERLRGSRGNDLLIAFTLCEPHLLEGGAGIDTASFIRAREPVIAISGRHARARHSGDCPPINLRREEAIEGSRFGDVLIGNDGSNSFLGRQGRDIFRGLGGRDSVDARDGASDLLIDCGDGRDRLRRDAQDPRGRSC